MTDKVVSLEQERARRNPDPHTSGPMKCERCGHEEPACVAPVGVKWFECAKCGCMSSKRAGPVLPADGVMRQSCPSCKSQTFAVLIDSLMCADCGTVVTDTWSKAG